VLDDKLLADALVVSHAAFVLFVVLGALAVARWPRLAWLHIPAVVWGILVEVNAWTCPLTPWEQALRARGTGHAYSGSFVDHYVMPVLYPRGLTSDTQFVLGIAVLAVNGAAYAWLWRRRCRSRIRKQEE
jgi:small-conductance mechanosensitive channel